MPATAATLHQDHQDDILVLTIDNPGKRNAAWPELYQSLGQALADAAAQPRVGAIVLTGANGYFCAGGDLNRLANSRSLTAQQRTERIGLLHGMIQALRDCAKPVIAAVEGGAAGAGLSIALACDLVVAADDATFSAAYVKAGLTPDGGLTGLLAAGVSRHLLTQWCLTGEKITAQQLQQAGLVNALTPAGQALAQANALAQRLGKGPSQAMASIKSLCRHAHERTLDQQLDAELAFMIQAQVSAESAEGIGAFLEKRAPDFRRLR